MRVAHAVVPLRFLRELPRAFGRLRMRGALPQVPQRESISGERVRRDGEPPRPALSDTCAQTRGDRARLNVRSP
jgi:hypothetical protein